MYLPSLSDLLYCLVASRLLLLVELLPASHLAFLLFLSHYLYVTFL